jgi:hypothetical protein
VGQQYFRWSASVRAENEPGRSSDQTIEKRLVAVMLDVTEAKRAS